MNHQQIDALSVDQLWDAVCLATKEADCICHWNPENGYRLDIVCPKHDGEFYIDSQVPSPPSGRVWALPGMQERCWQHNMQDNKACYRCHGTGWVANQDLGALLKSAWEKVIGDLSDSRLPDAPFRRLYMVAAAEGNVFVVLGAVAKVLVVQGAELGGNYEHTS